ncbi:hypothetical protein ACIP2Y_09350 [Streptomyces sviceus]|uniref:hypothetical protein n=1 Tax=Streptomyces sviceus TaxID=285530 RepID=UPI00380554D0
MKALALPGGLESTTDVGTNQVQVIVGDRPGFGPEEKPEQPRNDLAHGGVHQFTPVFDDAVQAIEPFRRGELEIIDARRYLAGVPLRHRPVRRDHGEVRISS